MIKSKPWFISLAAETVSSTTVNNDVKVNFEFPAMLIFKGPSVTKFTRLKCILNEVNCTSTGKISKNVNKETPRLNNRYLQ